MTGATLTGVSGSGTTYTVTASTGMGNGTLGLNLVYNDSIRDGSINPLGGPGACYGNFSGQVYTIDKTAPSVTINQAASQTDPTSASPIKFTVVFSETVTGFAANDISFAGSTVGGTLTAVVTWTIPTYNVAVSGMTWTGTVVASVLDGAATDAVGNASLVSASTDNTFNVSNTNFFRNVILATGFNLPTAIKFLPDGRMLVAELTGTIKVFWHSRIHLPIRLLSCSLNLNIPGYAGLFNRESLILLSTLTSQPTTSTTSSTLTIHRTATVFPALLQTPRSMEPSLAAKSILYEDPQTP